MHCYDKALLCNPKSIINLNIKESFEMYFNMEIKLSYCSALRWETKSGLITIKLHFWTNKINARSCTSNFENYVWSTNFSKEKH